MLKILNVVFTTRWGGLEQAFLNYNKMLEQSLNIRSVVNKKSRLLHFLDEKQYKIGNFSKYDPFTYFKFKKIVSAEKPDFILTHGNRAHYIAKNAGKNTKIIGIAHGYSFDYIKNCDYIFAVSKNIKNSLIKVGYSKDKIYHVPNIINLENYKTTQNLDFQNNQNSFSKRFERPILGTISRLEKEKGIDIFIRAINILKKDKISFKAVIAGIGSELENLKQLVKNLNLTKEVEFLGFVSDKVKFYQNIGILCVPSLMEPFGIVILEGFLYGKPVIASNASGPLEIINNKINGFLVPKGNYKELANCIKHIIKNHDIIPQLTQKAFQRVKLYDMKVMQKKLVGILEKLKV